MNLKETLKVARVAEMQRRNISPEILSQAFDELQCMITSKKTLKALPRERRIIERYFGLDGWEPQSTENIAKAEQVSDMYIRATLARAMERLEQSGLIAGS
jgi:DNA-directed RNA polymerase sigma subunit (sigma70/sigma32)